MPKKQKRHSKSCAFKYKDLFTEDDWSQSDGIDIFAVFPFLLLSECDGNWQVTAVLSQQAVDLVFVQEIFVLVVNIQDDVCSLMHKKIKKVVF